MATRPQRAWRSAFTTLQHSQTLSSRPLLTQVQRFPPFPRYISPTYSTASEKCGEDPPVNHFHVPKWIIYVFVPSSLGIYGLLTYLGSESSEIREYMKGLRILDRWF